ncbi:hypothetical protein [Gordonia sihwensis]|uniref:hypothetical protein n=1 Tax=Gordonia sihwensis TaxID=173559 RepID=UPI003D9719F1
MTVKVSDVEWETYGAGGDVSGTYGDYVIEIEGRHRTHTAYYKASMPNQRAWSVEFDYDTIANGEDDGLRACKKAALDALNAHRSEHG